MEEFTFVIPLFVVLVIAVFGISYYLKQRRRDEMQRFALQHGLYFSADDPYRLVDWPFALFRRGDGRGVENVMRGSWKGGDPVTAFDYWFYTESTDSKGGRSRSYQRFTCAMIEVPAAFPHLELAREHVLSWLADRVGLEDIELESPEFNRRYNVKAAERRFAFELLDARMIRWLVDADQGLAFEVSGNSVLAYRKRHVAGLVPMIEMLFGFRDRIPRVAWELHPLSS